MTLPAIRARIAALEAIMSDPNVSDTAWACAYGEIEELRAAEAALVKQEKDAA